MVRLSRLRHRLHAATAGAARSTAGPRTAPSGLRRPTLPRSTTTTWRTWGGADAGHAEARKGTPALGPQGRAVPAGRARLLRRRPPVRGAGRRVVPVRLARDSRRPAGRALVRTGRGLRAPARGTKHRTGESRCPGGLTVGPSMTTASR